MLDMLFDSMTVYFTTALLIAAAAYLAIISIASVIITVYDKRVSKIPGHRRVPEKRLLTFAALGGGLFMLVTMLIIRHKTKHPKFMVGIPAIIIAEYGIILLIYNFLKGM